MSERKRTHTVLYISIMVGVVIVALVAVLATRGPSTDRPVTSDLVGRPVPDLSGTTVTGAPFDAAQLRGRWVLVNFFATWCAPCVKEHPEIRAWSDAHAKTGDATVVAVVYGDEPCRAKKFFEEQGGDWPVVLDDPANPVSLEFGVTAPPESYLVAPDGTVVAKVIGGVKAAELDDLLAQAKAKTGQQGGAPAVAQAAPAP